VTALPLAGVRVVESALLEPGSLGMLLAGLGAEVIKVEAPGGGDYIRTTGWPFVDGASLMHWHLSRGKQSVVLDLRQPEGVTAYLDLVRASDVVIEGMRPGALARRGLTYERMKEVNPRIVFCSLSGYGATGPYRDMPSHGLGFDAWAGVAPPGTDEQGRPYIQDIASIGVRAGPVYAAVAILAGVISARATGEGCEIDVAQTDAAVAFNWLVVEGQRAYERDDLAVTGNPADGGERRPLGISGMKESVRYQHYASKDGYVLFMASEQHFWESFCAAVGRPDLFERNRGARYAAHALGDDELRASLAEIFAQRTTREWAEFGVAANIPIAAVNDSASILTDPHFQERMPWQRTTPDGPDLLPLPMRFGGGHLPAGPTAPACGQHTAQVLADVLGYDDARIAELRENGVLGEKA
jgi:crotonobetainyl-CoA:carnitine CoA-transferase CaiB-like acyl-CoA transferase